MLENRQLPFTSRELFTKTPNANTWFRAVSRGLGLLHRACQPHLSSGCPNQLCLPPGLSSDNFSFGAWSSLMGKLSSEAPGLLR